MYEVCKDCVQKTGCVETEHGFLYWELKYSLQNAASSGVRVVCGEGEVTYHIPWNSLSSG